MIELVVAIRVNNKGGRFQEQVTDQFMPRENKYIIESKIRRLKITWQEGWEGLPDIINDQFPNQKRDTENGSVVLGGASADGQGQQESWPEPHTSMTSRYDT